MSTRHELTIKSTDPRDADATAMIRRLSIDIASRYEDDDGSGSFTPEDVTVPKSVFLVAYLNSQPVGCGALRPYEGEVAEVKRMYVDAAARGHGIGTQILRALEANAQEFGYERIILETGIKQPEAIHLYEKAGYTRIPCYGIYKDRAISVCFEKVLQRAA